MGEYEDGSYGLAYAMSAPRGRTYFPRRSDVMFGIEYADFKKRMKDEGEKMKTNEDLLTEAENLRLQAERLEAIAAQREKYGDDPFKNGTVMKVDMKYRDTPRRTYAYGVVKTAGRYWLSGRLIPQNGVATTPINAGWTWEQFVAWLAQGDATVWQAKSLQQVL